mmetsp:Transcript_63000/g.146704  ORF Transcript_63000/g.146704 Transcript_63000/m.146704 type:complete len:224 (-) Transcript_63000:1496-2167(-)
MHLSSAETVRLRKGSVKRGEEERTLGKAQVGQHRCHQRPPRVKKRQHVPTPQSWKERRDRRQSTHQHVVDAIPNVIGEVHHTPAADRSLGMFHLSLEMSKVYVGPHDLRAVPGGIRTQHKSAIDSPPGHNGPVLLACSEVEARISKRGAHHVGHRHAQRRPPPIQMRGEPWELVPDERRIVVHDHIARTKCTWHPRQHLYFQVRRVRHLAPARERQDLGLPAA